jgi:SAM-dependent methyltransferase
VGGGVISSPDGAGGPGDWSDEHAERWARVADRVEQQILPVDEPLFDAAALERGHCVLDVGCGRGATTRRAAREVSPGGRVVGLDVAPALVEQARARTAGSSPIEWLVADAQDAVLATESFDRVISRFGCMFFAEPTVAFANLLGATAHGGRLCIAVWQHRDASPLHAVPIEVGRAAAAARGFDLAFAPPDGGPHSLGTADRTRAVLHPAGWTDVEFTPHEVDMYVGGPGAGADAVETRMTIGPLADALTHAPDDVVAAVADALHAEYARHHDGVGVRMPGAFAIVTARRR